MGKLKSKDKHPEGTVYHHENDLKAISEAIKQGDKHSLTVEIIWSAMIYLKSHPKESIEDAMDYGINEWIK
jgi:hypothetical protein